MVSFKYAAVSAVAMAAAVSASPASNTDVSELDERTFGLTFGSGWNIKSNYFCKAPWKQYSKPYWCYGKDIPGLPMWDGGDFKLCKSIFFSWKPFCKKGNTPKPLPPNCNPPTNGGNNPVCNGGYQQVFKDYTEVAESGVYKGKVVGAATIDNNNYLTYGLATSTEGCLQVCDQVQGCVFVNVYQDNADKPEDIAELPASAQEKFKPGTLTCAIYKACSGTDNLSYCKSGKC